MPVPMPPLTSDEVLRLPAMPPVKDAFRALNVSEGTGYGLIKKGEFPIEVLEFGRAKRVRRADLVAFLGLAETAASGAHSATGSDDASGVQPEAPSEQSAPTHASK